MRVAYLLSEAPFARQEQFVLEEAAALLRSGVEVRLFPLRPGIQPLPGTSEEILARTEGGGAWRPRTLAAGAIQAIRAPRSLAVSARALTRFGPGEPRAGTTARNALVMPKLYALLEALRRFAPDHLHAHFAATTATSAWIASDLLGVPWSFTAHSPTDIEKRNLLHAKVAAASFVRTISEDGRRRLLRTLPPAAAERVVVIPMGVRSAGAPADPPPRFRRHGSDTALVCVARLIHAKGIHDLVAAVTRLTADGTPVRCHVVGQGEERAALASAAEAAGVGERVVLHGYVPNPEVLAALDAGAFDVAVLPSYSEGVPVTLMEAMARGVPVVATRVGGTSELVVPGTGELVPPAEPPELANAIARQLAVPRPTIGREVVAERYCLSRNAERLARRFALAGGRAGTSGAA